MCSLYISVLSYYLLPHLSLFFPSYHVNKLYNSIFSIVFKTASQHLHNFFPSKRCAFYPPNCSGQGGDVTGNATFESCTGQARSRLSCRGQQGRDIRNCTETRKIMKTKKKCYKVSNSKEG